MLDKNPAEFCVVYLTFAEPDMWKMYFCLIFVKNNMLVYHVRIQKPPQSIGYHKRVLKNSKLRKYFKMSKSVSLGNLWITDTSFCSIWGFLLYFKDYDITWRGFTLGMEQKPAEGCDFLFVLFGGTFGRNYITTHLFWNFPVPFPIMLWLHPALILYARSKKNNKKITKKQWKIW